MHKVDLDNRLVYYDPIEISNSLLIFLCSFQLVTSDVFFCLQVNDIAFHPVHFCLLATVGSDGKFSFWDKDARTKLKVCTHNA